MVLAGAAVGFNLPPPAPVTCPRRTDLAAILRQHHGEIPSALGHSVDGLAVELLTSASGNWSVIVSYPGGQACLLATGGHWQSVRPAPSGGKTPSPNK